MKSRLTYFVFILFLTSAMAVAGCGKNKTSTNDDTADGADDGADTASSDGSGEDEAVELDLADCEDGPAETDEVTDDNLQAACDCFEATVEDCTEADDLCADAANMGECIDNINAEIAAAADTATDDATDTTEVASEESADGEDTGDGETAEEDANLDISQCTNGLAEGDDASVNAADFCECFDPEGANGCNATDLAFLCPAGTTVGECIEIVNAMAPAE